MSTRTILKEFLILPGYSALPAVSLPGAWSSFMNSYAVWPNDSETISFERVILADRGYYSVVGAVDNIGTLTVNGTRCAMYNFDYPTNPLNRNQTTKIYHSGGYMTIRVTATNTGGPRGVAATIHYYDNVNQTVGSMLWNPRMSLDNIGRYRTVIPFAARITVHAWGGGGGSGGLDATEGGRGSPGLYNTTTLDVKKGDQLEVFVGEGGRSAQTTVAGVGSTPGGVGGSSYAYRTNIWGDKGYLSGGTGGRAGPAGWSGGGGGGGGASGLARITTGGLFGGTSTVLDCVAGGGGGGGGGGAKRNVSGAGQDGTITNNATGSGPIFQNFDYRGASGSSKGVNQGAADGGGGGGGGGGTPGGAGGGSPGGDIPGLAGQTGGNYPYTLPFVPSAGTTSPYYKAGFGGGGGPPNGAGQNGRVVLIIEPKSFVSTKVANAWKESNEAWVKVSGSWKKLDKIYVKIGNSWKQVSGSGQSDLDFSNSVFLWGRGSSRAFGT